ncbi:MAG: flippase [Bulleidia sp.]|nr:flippase [Bulleidia sp.]
MNKFLKNTSWIVFGQIFQMILSFFIGLLSVRYLGPTNYGSITYISSYVSFFSSICLMGLDTVVINKLVYYQERDGEVIASAVLLRSIVSILCMFSLSLVVYCIDGGNKELVIIAIISSFELLFKSFITITFWYQYKLMSKKVVIADLLAFLLSSLYRLYLLMTSKNIYWFATYSSLIYLLASLFYIPMFIKDCKSKKHASKEMCKELVHSCIPYLISGIMISLYTQIDRIMIKQILQTTVDVGYYSAAWTVCNLIAFIPNAISVSARPVLMQMRKEGKANYNQRVSQVLAVIIWLAIFYSLFVTIFSKKIILILYGQTYITAHTVLKILVWSTLMENVGKIRDIWLIGENRSNYVTFFSTVGTILNVIINIQFIHLWGINGAALSTVITQFFVMLILPMVFSSTRQFAIDVINAIFLRNIQARKAFTKLIIMSNHKRIRNNIDD